MSRKKNGKHSRNPKIDQLLTVGERAAVLFASAAFRTVTPSAAELRTIADFAKKARAGEVVLQLLLRGQLYPAGFMNDEVSVRAINQNMPGFQKLAINLPMTPVNKAQIEVVGALRSNAHGIKYLSCEEIQSLTLVHEFGLTQSASLEVGLESFLKFAGCCRREHLSLQAVCCGDVLPRVNANGRTYMLIANDEMNEQQLRAYKHAVFALRSLQE